MHKISNNKKKNNINKDKTEMYATLFKFKSKAISSMVEVDIFIYFVKTLNSKCAKMNPLN